MLIHDIPSVLPLVRPHMPRPRLLRGSLDVVFAPNDIFRTRAPAGSDSLEPSRALFLMAASRVSTVWMAIGAIHEMSQINGQCMRRGCTRRRVSRCKACQTTEYCDIQCQRLYVSILSLLLLVIGMVVKCIALIPRDWQEHRLVCGFIHCPGLIEVDLEVKPKKPDALLERFPFRFGEVEPLKVQDLTEVLA